jgi:3-dehydroquinate synthase
MQYSVTFSGDTVEFLFNASFADMQHLLKEKHCVVITDSNIANIYRNQLSSFKTVVIPAGEEYKNWQMVETLSNQLMMHETHRHSYVVGVGGGLTTDITGFLASVYMRGVSFGFVPTTLLGMVDAAVGGKNGVNLGYQKNFLGTIQHPDFILYDTEFLKTLPDTEWSNGFAEIIKYACLFDKGLFEELEENNVDHYKQSKSALESVIRKCVNLKITIVQEDEKETGNRKLLNFGHTAGHAFETLYHLPHGHGVALGMIVACIVSEQFRNLNKDVRPRLIRLLEQYHLPTTLSFDAEKVMEVMKMDKKRNADELDYIMLNKISDPVVKTIPFTIIENALDIFNARHH